MCGIIAVLHRRSSRAVPSLDGILEQLHDAIARLRDVEVGSDLVALTELVEKLEATDAELHGPPGMACLLSLPDLAAVEQVEAIGATLAAIVRRFERDLDAGDVVWPADALESGNALLVRLKDVI